MEIMLTFTTDTRHPKYEPQSELPKGAYIGDYIGDYYGGYKADTGSLDYSPNSVRSSRLEVSLFGSSLGGVVSPYSANPEL